MNIYDTVKTHILFISSFIWKKMSVQKFLTLYWERSYIW